MQMLQHYREDNLDRWLEFCEWVTNKFYRDINSPSGILLQRKPILMLMERFIVKTYDTGVMPTCIRSTP
jgi:hypothetical protein